MEILTRIVEAVVAAGIPIVAGIGIQWLRGFLGEKNANLLISAAREAVLAVEEEYLASGRAQGDGTKKKDLALEMVANIMNHSAHRVIPRPGKFIDSEDPRVLCAVEAAVQELFNSPERQLAHAEALQRIRKAAIDEAIQNTSIKGANQADADVIDYANKLIKQFGLKPKNELKVGQAEA